LPIFVALAVFLAVFAWYSVAWGWNQLSQAFVFTVSAGVSTQTVLSPADRWIDYIISDNGTVRCGDDQELTGTGKSVVVNASIFCDDAIVFTTTGSGVSSKSFIMAFSTTAPSVPSLGEISVDLTETTDAIEVSAFALSVLCFLGGSATAIYLLRR